MDPFELSASSFELMRCFPKQLIHLRIVISKPSDAYQFDRNLTQFPQICFLLSVFICVNLCPNPVYLICGSNLRKSAESADPLEPCLWGRSAQREAPSFEPMRFPAHVAYMLLYKNKTILACPTTLGGTSVFLPLNPGASPQLTYSKYTRDAFSGFRSNKIRFYPSFTQYFTIPYAHTRKTTRFH